MFVNISGPPAQARLLFQAQVLCSGPDLIHPEAHPPASPGAQPDDDDPMFQVLPNWFVFWDSPPFFQASRCHLPWIGPNPSHSTSGTKVTVFCSLSRKLRTILNGPGHCHSLNTSSLGPLKHSLGLPPWLPKWRCDQELTGASPGLGQAHSSLWTVEMDKEGIAVRELVSCGPFGVHLTPQLVGAGLEGEGCCVWTSRSRALTPRQGATLAPADLADWAEFFVCTSLRNPLTLLLAFIPKQGV